MTTIHLNATVGSNGALDLHVPGLPPSAHVTVTVESASAPAPGVHIIDLIKDQPGHRLFHSADEVDDYLYQQRDAWDR